jgi:hypothetical protein
MPLTSIIQMNYIGCRKMSLVSEAGKQLPQRRERKTHHVVSLEGVLVATLVQVEGVLVIRGVHLRELQPDRGKEPASAK